MGWLGHRRYGVRSTRAVEIEPSLSRQRTDVLCKSPFRDAHASARTPPTAQGAVSL